MIKSIDEVKINDELHSSKQELNFSPKNQEIESKQEFNSPESSKKDDYMLTEHQKPLTPAKATQGNTKASQGIKQKPQKKQPQNKAKNEKAKGNELNQLKMRQNESSKDSELSKIESELKKCYEALNQGKKTLEEKQKLKNKIQQMHKEIELPSYNCKNKELEQQMQLFKQTIKNGSPTAKSQLSSQQQQQWETKLSQKSQISQQWETKLSQKSQISQQWESKQLDPQIYESNQISYQSYSITPNNQKQQRGFQSSLILKDQLNEKKQQNLNSSLMVNNNNNKKKVTKKPKQSKGDRQSSVQQVNLHYKSDEQSRAYSKLYRQFLKDFRVTNKDDKKFIKNYLKQAATQPNFNINNFLRFWNQDSSQTIYQLKQKNSEEEKQQINKPQQKSSPNYKIKQPPALLSNSNISENEKIQRNENDEFPFNLTNMKEYQYFSKTPYLIEFAKQHQQNNTSNQNEKKGLLTPNYKSSKLSKQF